MLIDPCELSPSYVRSIAPYQPGKPIAELAREMGLDEAGIVKLASNENPRGIGPRTRAAIDAALADIARYPDGNGYELKVALSRRYGVDMNSIVLGNGSNDVLELVALAFLGPGRAAVFSQHAFAVYPLATQARGARARPDPERVFVGGELDDVLLLEAELARHLGDRLAGLVRGDGAYVGRGQLAGIDQHQFTATG